MRTLAVSGWGQPYDALSGIAPDATHIDYTQLAEAERALEAIAKAAPGHDLAIGWSLGGQLLVRAIAAGMLRPKKLVLIAPSFRFVKKKNGIGMPEDTFRMFRDNYAANPERTLKKAWDLIAYGDAHAAEVKKHLARHDMKKVLAGNWQAWLDDLERFSCEGLAFKDFPPTLLVHGDRDAVVYPEQARRFMEVLPQARLATFEGCGHAPHWHDAKRVKELCSMHAR